MKRITRSRDGDEAKLCWGRLDTIENILGDDYDLERLKELVEADREGRCMVLPFKVGDTLYYIGGACEMLIKSATVEEMYIEDEVLVGVSSGSEFFTLQEKEWYETEKDALKSWNTRPAPPIGRCGECRNWNEGDCYRQELTKSTDYCSYFEPRERLL